MIAVLTTVRQYFIVVCICWWLLVLHAFSHTCWPFVCLWKNVCWDPLPIFIWIVCVFLLIWFAFFSSHSVGVLCILFMACFDIQKLFSFMCPGCLFLLLMPLLLVSDPKKSLPRPVSEGLPTLSSFRKFLVSGLAFQSLIHFVLLLCVVWDSGLVSSSCILLSSFLSTVYWGNCPFPILYF